MNKEPVLVIMAAGMGSRYGGLKQIDPLNDLGEIIIDFSIYDAIRAGFQKVIFIIRREHEKDFRECIGNKIRKAIEVEYVYQELSDLPEGFQVPEGRIKPWGTAHAILCCRHSIDGPFAVINADDYYGPHAFSLIYQYLKEHQDDTLYNYAMVGFQVENTLTDHGSVSRGVCETNGEGFLKGITERTRIERKAEGAYYTEDEGTSWTAIPNGCIVSMNLWGFQESYIREVQARFPAFLQKGLKENPFKCEYYLPEVVSELLTEGKAAVRVLPTPDRWYGVTYREDKPEVAAAIARMKEEGIYPGKLWE